MDESVLVINSSITIDETDGFLGQGNEIDPATLSSELSAPLFTALGGLSLGTPDNVSLQSGMISTPDGSSDLSWSDAAGEPLVDEPSGFSAYDPNSDTVEAVVLNTDTNNNLLIGTTATTGTVVFVAIIDDATGSDTTHDVFLISYLPLIHNVGDGTSLSLDVYISATADLTFDDFSDAPSGANDWLTFGDSSGGVQLLATSDPYETGPEEADNGKVNTSTIGLGADSQSVAVGSMVRIDLVSGSLSGADLNSTLTNDASALDYTQHEETREYQFGIVQTGGNAANRVDAKVAIFLVDDSVETSGGYGSTSDFFADSTAGTGETPVTISRIEVIDTRSGTEVIVSSWTPGGGEVTPTDGDAEVDYILNPDGSVDVDDVIQGYSIRVYSDSDFNRIETTNVSDNPRKNGSEGSVANKTFDIGAIEVGGITGDIDPATLVFLDDEPTAEGGGAPIIRYEDLFETPDEPFDGNDEGQTETGIPSLMTLIDEGADEPVTFGLGTDTSSLPDLTSGGVPITYVVDTSNADFDILTASAGTTVVFTVKVSTNGDVEVTFEAPVDHSQDLAGQPDGDELDIDLTDLLQGTDRDNDSVTFLAESLVLRLQDDAPKIVTVGTPDALSVDESDFDTDDTEDYSNNFDASFGGDGSATVGVTYELSIGTAGPSTGLTATILNEAVVLTKVGDVIIAETADTNQEVFRVSVDASGNVTLDQSLAVVHSPNAGPDDTIGLADDKIILTATAEDADEDTASVPLDISGAITLVDDAPGDPTVVITNENFMAITYDGGLSPNGNFVGDDGTGDSNTSPVVAVIDVSNHFTFGNLGDTGNDGGTPSTGYVLTLLAAGGQGSGSGLFSNGSEVNLYINDDGTLVTGSTAGDEGSVITGNTVFTLALSGSTLTLTQTARIDHSTDGTYNGAYLTDVETLADGLVGVVASARITDGDGDQSNLASTTLDLGGNVAFGDDGPDNPVVSLSGTEPLLKTFDGGLSPDGNYVGTELTPADTDPSTLVAMVDFSDAFSVAGDNNGADGAGATTTTYALGLASGVTAGTASGLESGGASINLFEISGVIYGSTAAAGADNATIMAGAVFTLAVSPTTGVVTQTQSGPIDHGTAEAYSGAYIDDTATLANDLVDLVATAVTTDSEGDTSATDANTLDMGGNVIFGDDGPDELVAADLTVTNSIDATASAALTDDVGADQSGNVIFVEADGTTDATFLQLQGYVLDDDLVPPLEDLLAGGDDIFVFGFGTDTLTATTNTSDLTATDDWIFQMTIDPTTDEFDIEMFGVIDNLTNVDFGDFVAEVPSGNPLSIVVNDIGGSEVDALFSGYLDDLGPSPSAPVQTTVNVSGAGVGVGTGQDFNLDGNISDRLNIQFFEDANGDGVVDTGEATTVNEFEFILKQNNSPADDADLVVRVYDADGNSVAITDILVNDDGNDATSTDELVAGGSATTGVASNDGGIVTATATADNGWIINGGGGGNAGSDADNDTITIITEFGYQEIDISGIGDDANKDTFDILLGSVAVPTPYDIEFDAYAQSFDEDGDFSNIATLDVTLDYDIA